MLTTKKIGVIAGGTSAEREVSLKSGRAVFNALKDRGYNVVFIDADRNLPGKLTELAIEIAFVVLHGGWGENGSVQGLLEVMDIPYTGSGVLASALAMDKVASKKMFLSEGLRVPPFKVIDAWSYEKPDFEPPWVVKPACEGSSVGVNIVDDDRALKAAIKEASVYGDRVIIEKYIRAKEVHVGILNNRAIGAVEVRPKRRFYDYTAKYTSGQTEYIIPPEITRSQYHKASEAALLAHRCLGCRGATRVDLLVEEENVYVLEVNTIPGMTETSLLPKIAASAGYSFSELIEEILKEALQLYEKEKKQK